jgi:hypothetical protein
MQYNEPLHCRPVRRYDKQVDTVVRLGTTEALARGVFFGSTGMTGNYIMLSVLWYGAGSPRASLPMLRQFLHVCAESKSPEPRRSNRLLLPRCLWAGSEAR